VYDSKLKNHLADQLFDAILALETKEECYRFFEDLATVSELQAFMQRWAVVQMLDKDETYLDIAKLTGASTATISRVKRSLNYGADGYKVILQRLKKKNAPSKENK